MFQLVDALQRFGTGLSTLGTRRLLALGITGLTVFALLGISGYLLSRPQQEVLYAGLESQDVTRIGAALNDAGIRFDVNVGGDAVLVNLGEAARARMLLAQKGLPRSDSAGYELFDKLGSLGLTTFMQQVTKVRALEGELSKTIRLIDGIKAARVHLALRSESGFRATADKPTASVIIRSDGESGERAASAIRHLVAASIPGLSPDQVTVMSADGRLLASSDDSASAAPEKLIGLERDLSRDIEGRLIRTLTPYLGLGNFQISVSTKLNTDRRQISETTFDPNSRVERSTRLIKESGEAQNATSDAGVTVEQNIPVEQAANPTGETSNERNDRKEELTNYEINSRSVSTTSDGYSIDRVTVALVVDRQILASSLGENVTDEAINARVGDLRVLASTAAGLIEERGDTITVSAVSFVEIADDTLPNDSAGFMDWLTTNASGLMNIGVLLLVTFLVVFLGLRPAIKSIMSDQYRIGSGAGPAIPSLGGDPAGMPMADMSIASSALDNLSLSQFGGSTPDPVLDTLAREVAHSPKDRLAKIVELDPERAAEVLKQWLNEPLERAT
ncbi:flagellar basal-body MS-ring/collar protein FliF [Aestuariivirga sp.]|uniref:flagellar basal-body MS-ring/collar protein FliF n=1 Tax=Aestuariivirga sp. TaxID=2650926 RepID=UPI003783BAC5